MQESNKLSLKHLSFRYNDQTSAMRKNDLVIIKNGSEKKEDIAGSPTQRDDKVIFWQRVEELAQHYLTPGEFAQPPDRP